MHFAEGREPLAVMSPEVAKDRLVGVEPQEFPYDLDGEDLCVGELWSGTALANATILDLLVHEAEESDDEGVKIHAGRPPFRSVLLG